MKGLTSEEVRQLEINGESNIIPNKSDKNVREIIVENVFTYFNFIFVVLSILVMFAGSYKSLTFMPVVIANTVIGIIQQIKAKRALDRLSLLDKTEYTVIRDGNEQACVSDKLVKGDLVYVKAGQQIPADGYVVDGTAYVNESLLTGEADEIEKQSGAELKSGSFIVSGKLYMTLTQVGEHSYAAKLMQKAKESTDKKSEMIRDIDRIIKISGIVIIPIGIILLVQSIMNGNSVSDAIVAMVAAVVGMIPEGMYLLTTVALALSASRLANHGVLLHDMRSIETLARVDVLCIDKTGTITNDIMTVQEIFAPDGRNKEFIDSTKVVLTKYIQTIEDTNLTMKALKEHFIGSEKFDVLSMEPFSSKTKYSSIKTRDREYRLGAPEFLMSENDLENNTSILEKRTKKGQRVLVFGEIEEKGGFLPLLFISLENEIRENAKEIFKTFAQNGVKTVVISGDNPLTVSKVALNAGIENADKYVDASTLTSKEDIEAAVDRYIVFGRVKPEQKKQIVEALQNQKLKVAMTGDGVNDILAMKKADCSIAMGSGSDAARQSAQVVLMDSDFGHMREIVSEGRRNINNITRSATLFLYKNLFSMFLAIFSIVNFFDYPLKPSQITLVSLFNIGIPSFFLALEANEEKQKGKFLTQTLLQAMPAALTSFLSIAALVVFSNLFGLPKSDIGTSSTYLLSVVGFIILFQLTVPLNKYRISIIGFCIVGFLLCMLFCGSLFAIERLSLRCIVLCALFALAEVTVMRWLTNLFKRGKYNA